MNQFDGRKGLGISPDSLGMECALEASGNRHRSARALLPSTLLTAALVLTGCSGAGSTEGESLPGDNRISSDGSSVGTVPTTVDASDAPMGPYGGGYGLDDGGGVAGEASQGPVPGPDGGGSGSPAGDGADGNLGADGSHPTDEKHVAADHPAANDGAAQPEDVDRNEDLDATAAGPEDEVNGTDTSTADEPDADEDTAGHTRGDDRDNEESPDGDEASAGAAVSGAFKNMSKACKAISAQMLSIAFAPLTYSYGGGRAEAKQAVSELTELKEKVPAELRDDFHAVEQVFAESGHAYSNFDEAAFEEAVIPIEEWVVENCPKLH